MKESMDLPKSVNQTANESENQELDTESTKENRDEH